MNDELIKLNIFYELPVSFCYGFWCDIDLTKAA